MDDRPRETDRRRHTDTAVAARESAIGPAMKRSIEETFPAARTVTIAENQTRTGTIPRLVLGLDGAAEGDRPGPISPQPRPPRSAVPTSGMTRRPTPCDVSWHSSRVLTNSLSSRHFVGAVDGRRRRPNGPLVVAIAEIEEVCGVAPAASDHENGTGGGRRS